MSKHCLPAALTCGLLLLGSCGEKAGTSAGVPFILDHNRILVDAEIQRKDGSWRRARLWVDTGSPVFMMSEELAGDLGIVPGESPDSTGGPAVSGVRLGGMDLDFSGVPMMIMPEPFWLFSEMHNDGNLPSSLLSKYHIVIDYPEHRLTVALPGKIEPRGERIGAGVHPRTGIPQIDAVIDGDSMSFAVDIGASYTFGSARALEPVLQNHPDLPRMIGTAGCANMWGWWPPGEESLMVARLPGILLDHVRLEGVAAVIMPAMSPGGPDLGDWYSQKTLRPVVGFLGPNAFMEFRMEIDYANGAVYLEKGKDGGAHPGIGHFAGMHSGGANDMDIVALTLRPESDGSFTVIGVPERGGIPFVRGVEPGDKLLKIGGMETAGRTFGVVVDALRGKPGDSRILEIERGGERLTVEAKVTRVI